MIKLNKATKDELTGNEDEDTLTIAVAGKGGTGKTTISGLIIRELVERQKGSVLAIDADPNANLDELLGFEVDGTIGELEAEVLHEDQDIPPGMTKKRWMELHLQQILSEGKGKDLLVMGRGEGPSCYCAVNNILREYLNNLARNYDFLVMDNEAGMEHLSRRTTAGIDALLIASDSNPISVKSARRIAELVDELDIEVGKKYLVLNRTQGDLPDKTEKKMDELELELLGEVPRDENVLDLCWEGKPIDLLEPNSPALKSVRKMVDNLVSDTATISPVKSE
ncbi:MAG: AAA family ATPase [Candidatus Bipolaricaulota bacterium]|nr:AAA family ATPase [Candidatus Bipolaricaulota bacterium]MBS3791600.1 AAA family ATPase [Candidatus Bipolaricaulota bacterium]